MDKDINDKLFSEKYSNGCLWWGIYKSKFDNQLKIKFDLKSMSNESLTDQNLEKRGLGAEDRSCKDFYVITSQFAQTLQILKYGSFAYSQIAYHIKTN